MGIRDLLGDDLTGTHVFTDFDGTLSPIVGTPEQARPQHGALDALSRLRRDGARVTVISGRPVSFLVSQLAGLDVELVGLYGLESFVGGRELTNAEAEGWIPAVEQARVSALENFSGTSVVVESKVLSLTVHYRSRPDLEARVLEWARRVSVDSGLQARPAKMSVELHPPISVDKGSAVKERVQPDTEAVLMIGDDVGDLSAFVAVADLEANMRALKVVVASPELDPQVAAIADITLGSPAEVVTFLQT